ncbi:MAG: hypothetical protein K1X53_16105 [Candidatus Sumerlaeaceae bacterium]|nr:hypothetical protein [Candidatus Sumerlaeaceae bacterium]
MSATFRGTRILALNLVLLAITGLARSGPAEDYLRAWSFRDYETMYGLAPSVVRDKISKPDYFAAAASLPVPSAEPLVVSRSNRSGNEFVYFQYSVSGETGAPQKGSIVVKGATIEHPELLAKVAAGQSTGGTTSLGATGPAKATGASTVVDGETLDSILKKMDDATSSAETLRARVSVSGSFMAQSINEAGSLIFKHPSSFRLDMKSFVMVASNGRSYIYSAPANMVVELGSLGDFEFSPGIGSNSSELRSKYDIRLAGTGDVSGMRAFKLVLKPTQSSLSSLTGGSAFSLWVSRDTWLPVRTEASGLKVDYMDMVFNGAGVGDKTFEFMAPQGATVLSLDSLMGAMASPGLK